MKKVVNNVISEKLIVAKEKPILETKNPNKEFPINDEIPNIKYVKPICLPFSSLLDFAMLAITKSCNEL